MLSDAMPQYFNLAIQNFCKIGWTIRNCLNVQLSFRNLSGRTFKFILYSDDKISKLCNGFLITCSFFFCVVLVGRDARFLMVKKYLVEIKLYLIIIISPASSAIFIGAHNLLLQAQMMIFLHHIRIECQEAAALRVMEGLLSWVLFPILGCMVKLIWRPKFTSLSKKHTVQF